MSDFDKEAERERLREKYEHDKRKREATEQMSELLLQGATMTNAHCSECNDPIFRYDGQEFCATCEKPVDRDTAEDSEDGENEESAQGIEVTAPTDDAQVQFGGTSQEPSPNSETGTQQPDKTESTETSTAADTATRTTTQHEQGQHDQTQHRQGQRAPPSAPPRQTRGQPRSQGDDQSATAPPADDVGAVRESLIRTMTRFSQQAEACEDPQRAREYLAATREAAETLEALRR
jgi:uncharacterized Zn finger protein (UPF0148 family)